MRDVGARGTFLTESVHALGNAEEKTPLNDA
jgi:hypothetical protein